MNKQREKIFTRIAKEHLGLPTLQTQKSDRLDFREVAVWSVVDAFEVVFQAGVKSGQSASRRTIKECLEASQIHRRADSRLHSLDPSAAEVIDGLQITIQKLESLLNRK